jgi:hypothetical protein
VVVEGIAVAVLTDRPDLQQTAAVMAIPRQQWVGLCRKGFKAAVLSTNRKMAGWLYKKTPCSRAFAINRRSLYQPLQLYE